MKDALTVYTRKNGDNKWDQQIRKYQTDIYQKRKKKREHKLKLLEDAEKYDIVCGQCKARLLCASKIVRVKETNHHLMTGEDIRDVTEPGEFEDEKNDHGDEVDRISG